MNTHNGCLKGISYIRRTIAKSKKPHCCQSSWHHSFHRNTSKPFTLNTKKPLIERIYLDEPDAEVHIFLIWKAALHLFEVNSRSFWCMCLPLHVFLRDIHQHLHTFHTAPPFALHMPDSSLLANYVLIWNFSDILHPLLPSENFLCEMSLMEMTRHHIHMFLNSQSFY